MITAWRFVRERLRTIARLNRLTNRSWISTEAGSIGGNTDRRAGDSVRESVLHGAELNSLVSVCIPAYRQPESLVRAIQSVLLQKSCDFEIVVTDDSADASAET